MMAAYNAMVTGSVLARGRGVRPLNATGGRSCAAFHPGPPERVEPPALGDDGPAALLRDGVLTAPGHIDGNRPLDDGEGHVPLPAVQLQPVRHHPPEVPGRGPLVPVQGAVPVPVVQPA